MLDRLDVSSLGFGPAAAIDELEPSQRTATIVGLKNFAAEDSVSHRSGGLTLPLSSVSLDVLTMLPR